jgi:GTP-binding protein
MLNVFELPLGRGAWSVGAAAAPRTTHHALYLLDLPGYGYARASHTDRAAYRELVIHVVERPRLAGVVWLLDIRRDPSPDDQAMREVFETTGTNVLAALTKVDKLPRGQRRRRAGELSAAVALPDEQVVATSAHTGEGIGELREALVGLIGGMTE